MTMIEESQERYSKDLDILGVWAETKYHRGEKCKPLSPQMMAILNEQDKNLESSPAVDQAKSELHLAEAHKKQAHAEYMPKVIAVGSLGSMQATELNLPKQNYSFAVGLTVPLFDGLHTTHKYRQAVASVNKAKHGLAATEEKVNSIKSEMDREIAALHARSLSLDEEIKTAKNAWETARKRYSKFQGSLQDLREAFRNFLRVKFDKEATDQKIKLEKFRRYLVVNGIERIVEGGIIR